MEDTDDLPALCAVFTEGLPASCLEETDDLTEDTEDAVELLDIKRSKEVIVFAHYLLIAVGLFCFRIG